MARRAIHFGELTERTMNGWASYRVSLSYGAFTISPQKLPNGSCYFYALKRAKGKLYKSYVGKRGEITRKHVHEATMKVSAAIAHDTGSLGRDNLAHPSRKVT
jgi:hypothetical protein